MTTQFEIYCALMAGAAYRSTREPGNRFPIPSGWAEVTGFYRKLPSGFEAISFQNGTNIVISYAGTDPDHPLGPDGDANLALATGVGSVQLLQAAEYYLQVKAVNPDAVITFTGHSLGGGLAALMGVFFNQQAVTFDQAPFANSMTEGIRDNLLSELRSLTDVNQQPLYTEAQLAELSSFVFNIDRTGNVSTLRVEGEFTSIFPIETLFNPIGTPTLLQHGPTDVTGTDLHSQALLTAFLQSDQSAVNGNNPQQTLSQVTTKLTSLLKLMFDNNLYAYPTSTADKNFLENLVRHETGVQGLFAADAMVTRFTADMWKLAQDGGMTMPGNQTDMLPDGTLLQPIRELLNKALIVFAMQKYYDEHQGCVGGGETLFKDISGGGGIQFDFNAIAANWNKTKDAEKTSYLKSFLESSLFSSTESNLIKSLLTNMQDWYVQAGASGMNATDTLNRGAFMLGGTGNDTLVGGTGADLLVGNSGADTLRGGQGNDTLLGGSGNDTYVYTTGDGLDTILDTGGQNILTVDEIGLAGGDQYGDARVHRDANSHLYVQADPNTLMIDGNIVIQNYTTGGTFELTMNGPLAETTLATLTGNTSDNFIGTNIYNRDPSNDYVLQSTVSSGTAKPSDLNGSATANILEGGLGADILNGGDGNDRLYANTQINVANAIATGNIINSGSGLKGDWLAGGAGDDTLVGSNANDVLTGGGGHDLLIGGAGNDQILGDADWVASSFNWTVSPDNIFSPVAGSYTTTDAAADVIYAGDGQDKVWAGEGNDVIFGEGGDDLLVGNGGNDILLGGAGKDALQGDGSEYGGIAARNMGDDYLDGGADDDVIYGDEGNDILIGGTGDDTLVGGAGQDTYIYNVGDGKDWIYDTKAENNILRFGAGVNSDNITLSLGSLKLNFGNGDEIHLADFDQNDVFNSSTIDRFDFEDGTSLNTTELLARGFDLDGTVGDDEIVGTNTTDRINGYDGSDTLIGLGGSDSLLGGAGDDELHGDADTVSVPLVEHGNDMLYGGTGNDLLYGYGGNDSLFGGDGNDELHGGIGDDVLSGGVGNDILSGDTGSDTYQFNRGDGQDIILDNGDPSTGLVQAGNFDTLQFGANITSADVTTRHTPMGELELTLNGTTDSITIQDWYTSQNSGNRLERIVFGNGAILTYNDFENLPITGAEGDDTITGSNDNDTILGLGGNDTLSGGIGNDILNGGAGNDVLDGGSGDDALNGGEGRDTYRFSYGMWQDTVSDTSSGGNVIELQAGVNFNDLRATQSGNDLLLTLRDTSHGMTVRDYYTTPQEWLLQDSTGAQQDIAVVLNTTNLGEYSALRDDFFAATKSSIASIYLARGYQWQADGSLVKSPVGGIVTRQIKQGTSVITTTYHWLNWNPDSVATNTYISNIDSYIYPGYSPRLSSEMVTLNETVISSDMAVIQADASNSFKSFPTQYVKAQINWGPLYDNQTIVSTRITTGTITDSYGVAVGWTETINVFTDYHFTQSGAITTLYPDATVINGPVRTLHYVNNDIRNLQEIVGGDSDNTINANNNSYAVVNGGMGNDILIGGGLLYGGEGNDVLNNGFFQYGGNGDDMLMAGNVLIGGEGNDTMNGAGYNPDGVRYLIDPTQAGIDLIGDTGDSEWNYKNWYYLNQGITNWETRDEHGGMYSMPGRFFDYYMDINFDSAVAAWLRNPASTDATFPDPNLYDKWGAWAWPGAKAAVLANHSILHYLEPLPPLERPAANDYAALQPLYDAGIIPMDRVEFSAGIALPDLSLSWGQETGRTTLELSWNNGASQVRLVVPNANDPLGFGVEQVSFADGTVVGMQELIELAPPMNLYLGGTEGVDILSGINGNDTLAGLGDGDILYGASGNDTLDGGAGNDVLRGGSGSDTYIYNLGDGEDRIFDSNTNGDINTLVFGAGIDATQITLGLGSLKLDLGNGNAIHIEGFNPDDVYAAPIIGSFQFTNGTTLSYSQLLERGFDIAGTATDDNLTGTNINDRISGGAGNDVLNGGEGSDTYVFGADGGQDTIIETYDPGSLDRIVFASGITASDLVTSRSGADNNNLTLSLVGSPAALTIQGWFNPETPASIASIEFADGSVVDIATLINHAPTVAMPLTDQFAMADEAFNFAFAVNAAAGESFMNDATDSNISAGDGIFLEGDSSDDILMGSAGNDYLYGDAGNDVLDGSAGNDELEDDLGNDTYLFGRGYGQDIVCEWDYTAGNIDTVRLAADILPSAITVFEDPWSESIILSINGTSDTLTIESWFSSDAAKVEQFLFADGTVWGVDDIMSLMAPLPAISIGSDEIAGTEGNDTIKALAGNDCVTGEGGDDVLVGGAGDDYLDGGAGSDILNGGSGSDTLFADRRYSDSGNNLLAGGVDGDNLNASIANDLLIGGTGNDDVIGDDGNDVLLFNRGDGADWYGSSYSENGVPLAQRTDTLSLGGGIAYADLSFERNAWDGLILNFGNGESIYFEGWFDTSWQDNKAIGTLQIIAEAMYSYDPNSSDPLLNKRVQQFDFVGLANQFEAALAVDPSITSWQLAPHLADFSLGGSDTAAIGGDMAYLYGKNGNLEGLSETELRVQLNDTGFGTANQTLIKTTLGAGAGIFDDVDFIHGDSLAYSATLSDGAPLPAWLTFDAATGTFSGVPAGTDAGVLNVAVTATDSGGLSATTNFQLRIESLNAAPVAVADLVAINEDAAQAIIAAADLLANDTDPDVGDIPSLTGFDAITVQGNTVTQDAAGDLVLNIGDRYRSLGAGQTASDSFSYTISDAADLTSTASVNVNIAGMNDAPVVGTAIASQQTDEDAPFSFAVPVGAFTDIDNDDTLSYSATLADGSSLPTWLTFDVTTQTFSGTPDNGDVGNYSVTVTATDIGGLFASSTLVVDVANINDAPMVNMALLAQGTLQDAAYSFSVPAGAFNDVDFIHGDTLRYGATMTDGSALPTWLSFDAAAQTFSGIPTNLDVGVLNVQVTSTDTGGLGTSSAFNLNVMNVNDAPIANADSGTATEDGGPVLLAAASLLTNDTDPDFIHGDVLNIIGVSQAASGAAVSLVNGAAQYDPGTLFQLLAQGQTATDTFGYTVSDMAGATSNADISMTITGVNDAPVTTMDANAAQEDFSLTAAGNVLANDSDVDQGAVLQVGNAGVFTGNLGQLALNVDGSYTYALDNTSLGVQSLAQGQVVTETFTYDATDGTMATPSTLTVSITGTNDAPVAVADAAYVREDINITASGNILGNDSDIDQGAVLSVADAGLRSGVYGSLNLAANGSYSYASDNTSLAAQSLGRDAQIVEHFACTVTDGSASTSSILDVFLSGTNDAPILVRPLADQNLRRDKHFSWQVPDGSFTDIDQGDTLAYAATLADGSALPDWLSFDATTRILSGESPKKPGFVDIRMTATDSVAATGSTEGSLSASDTFRISVSHGDDEDTPPPSRNANDVRGTSLGDPGRQDGNCPAASPKISHEQTIRDRSSEEKKSKSSIPSQDARDSDSHHTDKLIRAWFDEESTNERRSSLSRPDQHGTWGGRIDQQVNRNVARGVSGNVSSEWKKMNTQLKKHLEQPSGDGNHITESAAGSRSFGLFDSQSYPSASQLGMVNSHQMKTLAGLKEGLERLGC